MSLNIGDYADWEHRYEEIVDLMGEALRQNGLAIFQSYSGVAVNQAERRGPPAASVAFRKDLDLDESA